MDVGQELTAETTELLQTLIRNQCVNDGTAVSGQEIKSADVIERFLDISGIEIQRYEPAPGRRSVLARIPGRDPKAPRLLLLGHTDVVPVSPEGWDRDPFGGELENGFVWGRGAVDMLNLTSSMTVAMRELARQGVRPRGDIMFLAVADEEASGVHGTDWLLRNAFDDVMADYVVTEWGGLRQETRFGPRFPVLVEEKGVYWTRVTVTGTPGHGSRPLGSDNALMTAAEIVHRIGKFQPSAQIYDTWRRQVLGFGFDADLEAALLDPDRVLKACQLLDSADGPLFHACTHTTISVNVIHGGVKTNVIPDRVELDIDIRTLPGQTIADARETLMGLIGNYADRVTLSSLEEFESTRSPTNTPLWTALQKVTRTLIDPRADLVPAVMVAGTDNRFYRKAGATGYGFGLFSQHVDRKSFASMFHGNNERVDVESLRLSTQLWIGLAHELERQLAHEVSGFERSFKEQ